MRIFQSRKDSLILLLIIGLAIGLRLYCFRGFVGLDDAEYSRFANQMVHGTFALGNYDGPAVFPVRIGIITPTAVSYFFGGISELSMVLFPFILSIFTIFFAYLCAVYLFGNLAGLISACIWAVLPIDISNATTLVPDLPAAFFSSVGMICLLLLVSTHPKSRFINFSGGIFAGLLFSISWLCKESVLYLIPVCIFFSVLSLRLNWRKHSLIWAGVVCSSLFVLVGEFVIYYSLTGDWLFRFHEIQRNYLQWQNGFFTEGSKFGWPVGSSYHKALVKRLFLTGPSKILLNREFLYMPLFGIVACCYALYWGERSFLFPGLWLITLVLMYNFSSSSFSSYMPLPLFDRYLYPLFFPAVLITSGFIQKLLRPRLEKSMDILSREKFFWGICLTVFIAMFGGYKTFRNIRGINQSRAWTYEVRALKDLVKPAERIYTDPISMRGLEFFWGYPDKMNLADFEGLRSTDEIASGSIVISNRWYLEWLDINAGMWLSKASGYEEPHFISNPPASWRTVWKNENATVYRVE